MLIRLFLLFTIVPMVELALLITLGNHIGVIWTLIIVVTTGFTGAWMAKREGLSVLRQLVESLQGGLPPGDKVMEAALVVAGGLLLVTPGVLSDLSGMMFILPPTRRWLAPRVLRYLLRRFDLRLNLGGHEAGDGAQVFGRPPPAAQPTAGPSPTPFDHPVP